MKITGVKTRLLVKELSVPLKVSKKVVYLREIILIEISTDDGLTGIGFLTGLGGAYQSEGQLIKNVIDKALKPKLMDADPLQRELLWADMFRITSRFGLKGAAIRAISGVDIALWDLAGKACGLPAYKMAGYFRREIPIYISDGYYGDGDDAEERIEEFLRYIEQGHSLIKMRVGRLPIPQEINRLQRIRKAVGSRIEIMVDANEAWDINEAVRFCDMARDLDLYWVEEPLRPDDLKGYKTLAKRTNIPIAAGESDYTIKGMHDLIECGVRVLQPDVTRVGGMTEWFKSAALGQCYGIPCIPHGIQEVHVTCAAVAPNCPMTEFFPVDQPLQEFISALFYEATNALDPTGGKISPMEVPGLGLAYDNDLAERFAVQ